MFITVEDSFKSFRRHGGRLSEARAAFPSAPLPWIDLSTGVNPTPWQGARADARDLARLPDPTDIATLEATAATVFGCSPANVAAVPGADSALRLLPWITRAARAVIASPTYGGHADAWHAAGAEVTATDWESLKQHPSDAVIAVSPNNPDGVIIPPADLLDNAWRQDRWLIVDESFADVTPEFSVASHARDKVIVLRSFGKFFGLPGVRLGFVIAEPSVIAHVRALTGDWPVSADAVVMGRSAYADITWQSQTRKTLHDSATRLDTALKKSNFQVLGGTSLFRLTARTDAAACFTRLAQAGILVRPFTFAPTWLRFGIPAPSAWDRVEAALEACSP